VLRQTLQQVHAPVRINKSSGIKPENAGGRTALASDQST